MNSLKPEVLEKLKHYLAEQEDVTLAYLFGSYGRGDATSRSDIDIAFLLAGDLTAEERFDRRLSFGLEIGQLLRYNEIDVIILNDVHLALAYRVLRDGQLLACRDESARVLYTAYIVSRYLDFKPFIERHDQAILERARRGELLDGHNPYHGALERYRQGRTRAARRADSLARGVR